MIIVGMAWLSACGKGGSSCPVLIDNDETFQEGLLYELPGLARDYPYAYEAINDYGELRERVRACE